MNLSQLKTSACATRNDFNRMPVNNLGKLHNNRNAAKLRLHQSLVHWCNDHGFTLRTEFKFHETRKWRADFAIPELNCLIEFEGILNCSKSRHTTATGYTGDCNKYNEASILGYIVLRFTALNHKTVICMLEKLRSAKRL